MATLIIVAPGENGKYHDDKTYQDVIAYALGCHGAQNPCIGGIAVNPSQAALQMEALAYWHGQNRGSRLRQMILSFHGKEVWSAFHVNAIAYEIASFYGGQYQIVWGVHENTDNLHVHFVMSKVNYLPGVKYGGVKKDYYDFQKYARHILGNLGISLKFVSDGDIEED